MGAFEEQDVQFTYLDALLDEKTAPLAMDHDAVCLFVNDICNAEVIEKLSHLNIVRLNL